MNHPTLGRTVAVFARIDTGHARANKTGLLQPDARQTAKCSKSSGLTGPVCQEQSVLFHNAYTAIGMLWRFLSARSMSQAHSECVLECINYAADYGILDGPWMTA